MIEEEVGIDKSIPQEAKKRLEAMGIIFIENLRQDSIKSFVEKGKIWDTGEFTNYPQHGFASEVNPFKEVGILKGFFLPDTFDRDLGDQYKILSQEAEKLKVIPGISVIRGNVATYAALAEKLREEEKEDLFGENFVLTSTRFYGYDVKRAQKDRSFVEGHYLGLNHGVPFPDRVIFGGFTEGKGHGISSTRYVKRSPHLGTALLIVAV